ncbi:MAG TPA: serine hydrolase domain-containing protein [Roseiarcus sp.]|jgi:CubicO group peptidase (beta-lactamase class C family)
MPAICPPDPGPAGVTAVEAAITTAMSACSVPSISYALISCGKVFAANAHGTASPNVAASSSTLYQAASISKTLAAVGGLYAIQANAKGLTLDSDITAFQTSWKLPSGTSGVTLRRLLGMTAGANVHGYPGYAQTCTSSTNCQVPTLLEILNGYSGSPAAKIVATPGTNWVYSGGGFEIAESLIGDVMGIAYGDFVQEKVLAPLSMTSSTWGVPMPSAFQSQAAYAYVKPGTPASTQWNAYPQLAAAGLWTTPTDLAKLLVEIGNALADGGTLLTTASAVAMLSPVDNFQYGLGGAIRNMGQPNSSLLFMKSGGNLGFSTWLAFYPELGGGEGLVVFTNYDGDAELDWKPKVFAPIFQAARKTMNWPNFPGLEDCGPPVGG